MRIVYKLTLAFWFLAMIPMIIGATFINLTLGDIMIKDALSNLASIAEVKKEQIKRYESIQYSILAGIITGLDIDEIINTFENNHDNKKLLYELKKARIIGPYFNSVFIINNEGKMIASSQPDEQDFDYSSYDFFKHGRGEYMLNDFRLDKNGNGQFFITLPLNRQYSIGARVNAVNLQSIAGSAGLGNTGEVFLVKPDHLNGISYITPLRFNADAVLIGKTENKDDIDSTVVAAVNSSEDVKTYSNLVGYNGQDVLAAVCYLKNDDIGIVVQINKSEILESLSELNRYIFMLAAILIVFLTIGSVMLARSIARPIELLTSQVQKKRSFKYVSNKDLWQGFGGGLELKKLAYEFNETFLELARKERELDALNISLRRRVEDEIRKRTKNEMALDIIFENMPIGVALIDDKGNFTRTNEYFAANLGYLSEELVGHYAAGIIGPYLTQSHGAYTMGDEKMLVRKDKTNVSAYLTSSQIGTELFIAYIDISYQKELIATKRQQEVLLIQQSKLAAMGEMIGAIAHQWRQPIAAINGAVMNLSLKLEFGDLNKSEIEWFVSAIVKQTLQMSNTINDFMNFFSPNKNAVRYRFSDIFTNIMALVGSSIETAGIVIINNIPQDLSAYGYKNELEQVILNLLQNAKDAFEERHQIDKKILLFLRKIEAGDIYICIDDNAGGIEETILDRIFEPYYTTKSQGKGTGIGLYMSKIIMINSFGGDLYVSNIYEKDTRIGARFTIRLPQEIKGASA